MLAVDRKERMARISLVGPAALTPEVLPLPAHGEGSFDEGGLRVVWAEVPLASAASAAQAVHASFMGRGSALRATDLGRVATASWSAIVSPGPSWRSTAATRTSAPPASCIGAGCSPSSHAASATPTTGSSVARMAARDAPRSRMPVMKHRVGMAAPMSPASKHRQQGLPGGQRGGEPGELPGHGGDGHVADRGEPHRRCRCLDRRDAGEAVARGQDVEGLGERRQEREADAEPVQLAEPAGPGQGQDEPDEREAERRPANEAEPLAEPEDRCPRHDRGIAVEDEQREPDLDPQEGDEHGQVEDEVGHAAREDERPLARRDVAEQHAVADPRRRAARRAARA